MNRELLVVVPEIVPPFVNYVNYTEEYEVEMGYGPGIVWQVLRQLAKEMNLTYNVKKVGYSQATRWDDAFSALHHTEAEIIVGAAVIQANTDSNVSFSHPFLFEATGVLYRLSGQHIYRRYGMVYTIFPVCIALAIIVCLALAALYLKFTRSFYCSNYSSTDKNGITDVTFTVLAMFFRQSVNFTSTELSTQVFIMTMYLFSFMMFIAAIAASFFLPNLNYDYRSNTFKTFQDVVNAIERSRYTVVLHENSARTMMIQKSVIHEVKRLWDYIDSNGRVIYTTTLDEGVQLVRENPNYLLVGPYDTLNVISKSDCRLELVPQHVLPAYQAIAMKYDSEYVDPMNKIVLRLVEHGFIEKWITGFGRFVNEGRQREPSYCTSTTSQFLPIKLPFVTTAFVCLAVGVLLSVVLLGLEVYVLTLSK
ncbi:unnamed protein product [Bursaphelenchus okinawaensis]|uniref:Ionotropic glutamate receptor L-glutamate and glycine-binding domain-containing protein n=1 Tax=Bursaphelenchus okinawaensis TaxID=465554 RepID=A0A811KK13_9BILA|nr:unnamed protein product [Bursaphelenchus okinawaensis]CAG9104558.1 unnamed protein product [Bursaphelenchus okinawaensis]